MLQKFENLDAALNKLDEINKQSFLFENFKQVNSQIENLLSEINSNELNEQKIIYTEDYRNIFRNMLNKIERLERKILPKANLLEEFSKSKI
jgi:phosphoenolpyruvate carboxylase